jgi:hypothetical protein
MSDPDEALIEAIAEAIVGVDMIAAYPARPEAWYPEARAAFAAMVEHLGLVEETRTTYAIVQRRLVSRWVEVEHGSE